VPRFRYIVLYNMWYCDVVVIRVVLRMSRVVLLNLIISGRVVHAPILTFPWRVQDVRRSTVQVRLQVHTRLAVFLQAVLSMFMYYDIHSMYIERNYSLVSATRFVMSFPWNQQFFTLWLFAGTCLVPWGWNVRAHPQDHSLSPILHSLVFLIFHLSTGKCAWLMCQYRWSLCICAFSRHPVCVFIIYCQRSGNVAFVSASCAWIRSHCFLRTVHLKIVKYNSIITMPNNVFKWRIAESVCVILSLPRS